MRHLIDKTPDALIAATALVSNSVLLTRNMSDFKHIPGLVLLSPDDAQRRPSRPA